LASCPLLTVAVPFHHRRHTQAMVLHITDYSFGEAGASKLHHQVAFGPALHIAPQWCTEDCQGGRKHANYRLIATITHHGRHASGAGVGGRRG
jgi:hypothetical protein